MDFEDRYYLLPLIFLQNQIFLPSELLNACERYTLKLKETPHSVIEQTMTFFSALKYFEANFEIRQKILIQSLRTLLKSNWHILEQIDFLGSPKPITKGLSPDKAGINGTIYRLKVGLEYKAFSRPDNNPYEHLAEFFQLNDLKSEDILLLPSSKNRCKACGLEMLHGSTFCPHCGIRSDSLVKLKLCFYCGKQNLPDSKFCSYCGREQPICVLCTHSIFRNQQYIACKSCDTRFHWIHLLNYVRKHRTCPVCFNDLSEKDLSKEI